MTALTALSIIFLPLVGKRLVWEILPRKALNKCNYYYYYYYYLALRKASRPSDVDSWQLRHLIFQDMQIQPPDRAVMAIKGA